MPKLSTIQLFQEVVRSASFSAAGRKVGLPPSSVSRHIASLEDELNTQLFFRNTRQLRLTDAGQYYFDRMTPLVTEIAEIHQQLADLDVMPVGLLRITAPTEFSRLVLSPLLTKYYAAFPQMRIELIVEDGYVDLIRENVDLAIRIGHLRDVSLIARKLADDPALLCASESYLASFGRPEYPADLARHNCLRFEPPGDINGSISTKSIWRFARDTEIFEVQVEGSIVANSVAPLITAALEGLGIVAAPKWSVTDHIERSHLVPILSEYKVDWDASDRAIYAVYPPTQYLPRKIRSFIDFIAEEFRLLAV
jgi:DNA-binding transcriptional LysR family regulator